MKTKQSLIFSDFTWLKADIFVPFQVNLNVTHWALCMKVHDVNVNFEQKKGNKERNEQLLCWAQIGCVAGSSSDNLCL